MSRPEGSVVFLTTNEPECLDAAVTRSRRIDRFIRMDYATPDQAARMTAELSSRADARQRDAFVRDCGGFRYTTADLHAYLFSLDSKDTPSARSFKEHLRSRRCEVEPATNSMYL